MLGTVWTSLEFQICVVDKVWDQDRSTSSPVINYLQKGGLGPRNKFSKFWDSFTSLLKERVKFSIPNRWQHII